ncbi:MAG: hypothetical protein AAF518_24770 [Spirochaetota bacterium]
MAATSLLAVAIPVEHNAARKAAKENQNFVPVGDSFIILENTLPSTSVQLHINRRNLAGAALVAVFAFHFYDVIYNKPKREKKDGISILQKQSSVMVKPNTFVYSKEVEVKYMHHF